MTFPTVTGYGHDMDATVADLVRRVEKLSKINAALMQRVERSMDQQASAFSLFQTAIGLESQVRIRTEELKSAMTRLEAVNDELVAARDTAELANRFKTRFFTAVGHDLLQPLHAARLSLSAMEEGERDQQQERLAQQIDHSLSTIEELLRTILDLSKLEAGAVQPRIKTFPLADVFQSLALDLEPIARAKDLALTWRSTNALVTSDPLMLRRILQNLMANAVHYTVKGGIKLGARRRGGDLSIEVWDTGPGIAPADHGRIFEEFQRGPETDRSGTGGFGLGLSIVQRTADALGHPLKLCSRVGHGTRFSVLVPYAGRAARQSAMAPAPARQAYGFGSAKIVVIDNDVQVLTAMRTLLERWSCDSRFAADLAGIDELHRSEPAYRPDIVLADFHLDHGETGITAIDRLREIWGANLPAVVVTADHSDEVASIARRASCEILRKPVRPAELRALMQHLLSGA